MRILILSYSYPPVANARAVRWSALAEEWVRLGHEVAVVCSWVPGAAGAERLNGVAVHRAGLRFAEKARRAVAQRRRRSRGTLLDLLRSGAERAWRALYWPDTSCVWIVPAYRRARAVLRELRPDAVVSVSPTFSAVVLGMGVLARGKRVRWLVDLGDPFSWGEEGPPNNLRLYRALNRSVERAAFRRAAAVTVTTEETRARYAAAFGESADKIEVLPPLVSPDCTPGDAPASGGELTLVYVGTLYRTIRGPDFLLALFRRLLARPIGRRLQLHIYGDLQDCLPSFEPYADLLGGPVKVHGIVPRAEALEVMRRASVLVNIGNRTSYQLPSKLVDYAALGKPILNIAGIEQDSSSRFLQTYPRRLNVTDAGAGPDEIQAASCERFLGEVADGRLAPVPPEWTAAHALRPIAQRYLALLAR